MSDKFSSSSLSENSAGDSTTSTSVAASGGGKMIGETKLSTLTESEVQKMATSMVKSQVEAELKRFGRSGTSDFAALSSSISKRNRVPYFSLADPNRRATSRSSP